MPRFHLSRILLIASLGMSVAGWNAESAGPVPGAVSSASRFNGPSSFGLEARALKDGPAVKANVVVPLFGVGHSLVLTQLYGFKGDAELAGIGAGVIARYRIAAAEVLEVSAFIDGLRDREGFSYPQLGMGFAYSRAWFTARANGYLPLRGGDERTIGTHEWSSRNGNQASGWSRTEWSQELIQHESPARGFEAEIELRLPQPPRWVDPRIAAGYYYFEADDRSSVHSGLTLRGELHFGENWAVEGAWRSDASEIGQEYRFVLRYQKWFGGEDTAVSGRSSDSQYFDHLMRGPVEREPWPTITRARRNGPERRGDSRQIQPPWKEAPPAVPDDCCPNADGPLIFE